MEWDRSILRLVLVLVALPGLTLAPEGAAAAKRRALTSTRPYKLSVAYTATYVYKGYGWMFKDPTKWAQDRGERRITTYWARSSRPFSIRRSYRGACRRTGCLSFRAQLSGQLDYTGTGYEEECWVNVGFNPGQTGCLMEPPERMQVCTADRSEWGKGRVAGVVGGSGPAQRTVLGIDFEPDLLAEGGHMSSSCGAWPSYDYAVTEAHLVMPPSKESTAPHDLRRRFGQAFTIRYPNPPRALPDRPNRVVLAPDGSGRQESTETYQFSWTLNFTPVVKR